MPELFVTVIMIEYIYIYILNQSNEDPVKKKIRVKGCSNLTETTVSRECIKFDMAQILPIT